jgi:trigger factor
LRNGRNVKITVTSERTEDGKGAAAVTVGAADVDETVKKTYRDIAHRYNFQGFRRGRAPRPVIDSLLGKDGVLAQATEDLINMVQPMMIEELDLVPVERPDWGEAAPVVEHEDYQVSCTVTVPPTAALKSYEAPAITMPPATAKPDAEIDCSNRTTPELPYLL